MQVVKHYIIELQTYHNEIVGRLRFVNAKGETEDSSLQSLGELQMTVEIWKMGELLGSFAIGAILANDATFTLVQKT